MRTSASHSHGYGHASTLDSNVSETSSLAGPDVTEAWGAPRVNSSTLKGVVPSPSDDAVTRARRLALQSSNSNSGIKSAKSVTSSRWSNELSRACCCGGGSSRSPSSAYAYFVSFASAISGFLFGYDIGIIDTVLKMPSFQTFFGTATLDATTGVMVENANQADTDGNIVSSFLAGCMVGAMLCSLLADSIGRKRSILVGAALFSVGGILQAVATSLPFLYSARALSGISIGLLSSVTPLYLSEIAPASQRGRMVTVQQLMITVGILVASCVNAGMYLLSTGDEQWRGALGAQTVPGIVLLMIIGWLPFSPRWLLSNGREAEAVKMISRLRACGMDSDTVRNEVEEIKSALAEEGAAGSSTWIELTRGSTRKRVLIACILQFFQQWTGINFILYFAADLFARIGVDKDNSATTLVIINAALLIIGTLPGLYAIEVAGRRKLLVWGGIAMAVCHLAVCSFISAAGDEQVPALAWAAVVAMFSFTFAFSATWGPVVWVVQSEILPLRARARGTAVATLVNWSMNTVIGKVTPLMANAIEQYTYAVFATMCVLMVAYVYLCVPETMGLSLEAMDTLFSGGKKKGIPTVYTRAASSSRSVDGSFPQERDRSGALTADGSETTALAHVFAVR